MKGIVTIVCAALLVPALAAAEPKTAAEWYKEGETQYNLGNFSGAVEAFKKGFELEPDEAKKAAYLYNVGQAYRQAKDCGNAVFFYKRFLALKNNDTKKPLSATVRQDTERLIKELEECVKQQEALRQRPPDANLRPDEGERTPDPASGTTGQGASTNVATGNTEGEGDGEDDAEDEVEDGITATTPTEAPRLLSARLVGGGAKVGAGDLEVPIQATFALIGGYPLAINEQLSLDVGAGFTFTPIPFDDVMGASKSASLIGLVANVGATYAVAPKIGVRGDLGLGGLFLGGASQSPFTGNAETTGALTMFHVRLGVSADYAITPNVIATVAPFAFSYSPAKAGLREDISAITAIDFMVGVGYRM